MTKTMIGIGLGLGLGLGVASAAGGMSVRSTAFQAGGPIPMQYSCEGKGVSPPLEWSNVPSDTKSLAVIVDDPDAPKGTFAHLVIADLPPSATSLPEDVGGQANPPGAAMMGMNSKGEAGWAPVCPPSGQHRYRFKVYALDRKLSVPKNADARTVENAMRGHVLAQGELDGTFQKGEPLPAK